MNDYNKTDVMEKYYNYRKEKQEKKINLQVGIILSIPVITFAAIVLKYDLIWKLCIAGTKLFAWIFGYDLPVME